MNNVGVRKIIVEKTFHIIVEHKAAYNRSGALLAPWRQIRQSERRQKSQCDGDATLRWRNQSCGRSFPWLGTNVRSLPPNRAFSGATVPWHPRYRALHLYNAGLGYNTPPTQHPRGRALHHEPLMG